MKKNISILIFILSLGSYSAKAQIITTIAGTGVYGYSGDGGQATLAQLGSPTGLVFDSIGNLFMADHGNNLIRKIDTNGIITTFAGTGTGGYSGDGGLATSARFDTPTGLAFDKHGNLYVSDQYNYCVRKINTNGIISTIAGTGIQGFSGDGGQATAAQFYFTSGLIFDKVGNLYIGDANHRVRKIDTIGIITTFAGTGIVGNSGNGGSASSANLNIPGFQLIDTSGNFFFSDQNNNNVRKISSLGIISTIATGFSEPEQIAFDLIGNIYVADFMSNRIKKIDISTGTVSIVVGNGNASYAGDGGSPISASLNYPFGVVFDKQGNLYIADAGNRVIRKVSGLPTTGINQMLDNNLGLNIYPNPNNGLMQLDYNIKSDANLEISDLDGRLVGTYFLPVAGTHAEVKNNELYNGVYIYRVTSNGVVIKIGKIIVMQ